MVGAFVRVRPDDVDAESTVTLRSARLAAKNGEVGSSIEVVIEERGARGELVSAFAPYAVWE